MGYLEQYVNAGYTLDNMVVSAVGDILIHESVYKDAYTNGIYDFHNMFTYIEPILNQFEELKCGVGRYNLLMENIDSVKSEEDMFNLMKRVSYSQVYDPYNSEFDVRSENVGVTFFATYDILMDEENKEFLYECFEALGSIVRGLSRQEKQDINEYWESSFTEVVNCNEKTILVRFFENENKVIKIDIDGNIEIIK